MLKWTEGSDYVRRYRALDASGAAAPTSWSLLPSELPLAATSRLGMFNLTPSDLSPFALQALAWDLGLVAVNRSGTFSWAQVFVKRQGDSMADIAATFDSFTTSPTQTTRECVGGPNGKYLRQERTEYSTFYAKVTKCAVEVLDDVPDGLSAMLAQDALATTDVPSPLLRRHEGPGVGETNMAIHTSPNFGRWPWGECPPSNQPAGLIIPCDFNVKTALLPASSPAMDGWLQDIATRKVQVAATTTPPPPLNPTALPAVNPSAGTSSRPVQATPTVAYVGSGLGLVALVLLVWWCRRRYRRAHPRPLDFEPYLELTATPKGVPPPPPALSPVPSFSLHAVPLTRPMRRRFEGPPPLPPLDSSMILLRLDTSKRLDFGTIECVEVLASGPVTSVYFGYYHARPVAIKALSTSVEINQVQVDTFIEEIRLMASFNHPNIVELVGYAWQDGDPRSLVAVTEYLSQGNLLDFLIAHPRLEWANKAPLALSIARALQYLHVMLQPIVVHRDLTSTKVLVAWPHAKLSGFAVSSPSMDHSIGRANTAGVGMYVAPEVLDGSACYSVAADMYSFGCVLVELDTQTPLSASPTSTAVFVEVCHGTRKPQVSPACPGPIRDLASQCLHTDPSLRPSAFDVARALEAFIVQS